MRALIILLIFCVAVNGQKDDCNRGPRNPPQCGWYYLAYAPRILRAGVDEKVLVTTYNVNFEVEVKATLRDDRDSEKVIATGLAKVPPGVLTEIVLKVPIGAPSAGTIKIEGEANVSGNYSGLGYDIGWKFENVTKSISIQKSSRTMFIQTDRPIYKPGEAMRLRVVAVDSNLKALTGEISRVSVLNPKNTLIRQWRNLKLQNGVANLKLKFSVKPVLGRWKIQSQMSGLSKTVVVKVEKYVLPKFQVKIKPPSYIALGQSKVFGNICAKYSYGKDVNGLMTAKVCALIPGYWDRGWNKPTTMCEAIVKKIYGCAPLEINLHSFGVYNYSGYRTIRFKFEASVKERATGITLNATSVTKPIDKTDVKLSFSGTSDIFKPGLPFEAVLLVTRPDDSRADVVSVKVEVFAGWSEKLFDKHLIVRNGRAKIDLPEIPFNAKKLRFQAAYERPKVHGSRISSYRRRTTAYHTAKAWYSPSHSYINIDVPSKVFKVGQEAAVNVRYTVVDPLPKTRTVYYTLMCKGYVAHSASIDALFVGTNEVPTVEPKNVSKEVNASGSDQRDPPTSSPTPRSIILPDIKPFVGHRFWPREKPVTRPPLPSQFSAGSFQIAFNVTQNMSPSCRMLVYYVRNRETIADSKVIDIEDSFANKVSMKFNKEEVFPGTKVKLSLKASPGSVFAISAVDKSVHFLGNANDISRGQVTSILKNLDIGPGYIDEGSRCRRGGSFWWYFPSSEFVDSQKAFNDAGMIFLSNVVVDSRPCGGDTPAIAYSISTDAVSEMERAPLGGGAFSRPSPRRNNMRKKVKKPTKKPTKKPPKKQIRSDFPETWLWTEEQLDAQTGEKTVEVKVPDTITTWHASGFAISSSDGLGVANPAEIKGFKALFASVNLPYAVTRNELVTIPVVVFNYLSECLNVRISMKSTKDIKSITRNYMTTCLCGGKTATVMFKAYAKTLGRILVEAKAESLPKNICPSSVKFDNNSYIDVVRKKLLVEPEGIEKEYTYNSLVCPNGKEVANNVKLAIPDKVVAGSVYAELRVIGDLMGPSLANIDSLLKMPYGCGEQNMLNFAPNIFIMQYLQATHQLTAEIKQKATDYTLQGYQRELSYKHSDGSYSAFGERDPEGSMWLTAFVLKSFAQARDFIEIDKKVMKDAKRWILRKQTSDGCFPSVGTLHHKAMKGGVKTPVTLTGYVVVALLEAGMNSQNPSIISAINKCIAPDLANIDDTYSLNILAYTMNKAGRTRELAYLLTKLNNLAIRENGNRYWGEPKQPEKPRDDWFYAPYRQAKSTDIEQTAYGLMASIGKDDKSKAINNIDIVRWLSQQRNSLGGWSSTQDTVLAMQALAVFSSIVYGGKQDMTIDVAVPGMSHKFTINNDNKLVLQRLEIPPKFPALLKTYARGQGCSLLSASVKYNVKDVQEDPAFKLEVNLSPLLRNGQKLKFGRCHSQEIDICARWLREDSSNMAIIAVKMLSGFEPIIESLDKAVSRDILLKEYEKKEKEYVFYYNRITRKGVCLRFKMEQKQIVEAIQPASVKVYDYYETELSATKIYKVTPAQCAGIPSPNT